MWYKISNLFNFYFGIFNFENFLKLSNSYFELLTLHVYLWKSTSLDSDVNQSLWTNSEAISWGGSDCIANLVSSSEGLRNVSSLDCDILLDLVSQCNEHGFSISWVVVSNESVLIGVNIDGVLFSQVPDLNKLELNDRDVYLRCWSF